MRENLFECPPEAPSLIVIASFHNEQDTADSEERGAYEGSYAAPNERFIGEFCARRREGKPVPEPRDNEDSGANGEQHRNPPGNIPPCHDSKHAPDACPNGRPRCGELRFITSGVGFRYYEDMSACQKGNHSLIPADRTGLSSGAHTFPIVSRAPRQQRTAGFPRLLLAFATGGTIAFGQFSGSRNIELCACGVEASQRSFDFRVLDASTWVVQKSPPRVRSERLTSGRHD